MFKYKTYVNSGLEPGNKYLNPCLNYPLPQPQFHGHMVLRTTVSIVFWLIFHLWKNRKKWTLIYCFPQVPMTKFTFFLLKSNILQNLGGTTNLNQEKPISRQAPSSPIHSIELVSRQHVCYVCRVVPWPPWPGHHFNKKICDTQYLLKQPPQDAAHKNSRSSMFNFLPGLLPRCPPHDDACLLRSHHDH